MAGEVVETMGDSFERPLFQFGNLRIWRDAEYGWGTSGDRNAMIIPLAELAAQLQSERDEARREVEQLRDELQYATDRWRNFVRVTENGPRTRKDTP